MFAGYAADIVGTGQVADAAEPPTDQVVTHPRLEGVPLDNTFTVRVRPSNGRWRKLKVYRVVHSLIDPITGDNSFPSSSMAAFDFDGSVEVEITYGPADVERVRVRPDSYDIVPELRGRSARFTLDRPCNLVVQVDEKVFDCLHLLANAIEQEPPKDGDPNVLYFGPGLHAPAGGELRVPSDTVVYLAPGAVLESSVRFENVRNSRLRGRGVVYNSDGGAIFLRGCENITIEGITVLNPRHENVRIAECRNVTFDNLRAFSHGAWGDGIQLYSSENVTIDGCFLRTSDDSIALYTHRWDFYGDTRDITVRNSSLWADVAHPINIGVHGNPDPDSHEVLENLRFENIDVLDHREPQAVAQGCLAINVGDGNLARNIRFEDIRVENFRWGRLIHMQVSFNPNWNTVAGRGIESIYVKDLTYNGANADSSLLIGLDADHLVEDVTFENLRVNGRVIRDSGGKPDWYLASDGVPMFVNDHVRNLRFLTTQEARDADR